MAGFDLTARELPALRPARIIRNSASIEKVRVPRSERNRRHQGNRACQLADAGSFLRQPDVKAFTRMASSSSIRGYTFTKCRRVKHLDLMNLLFSQSIKLVSPARFVILPPFCPRKPNSLLSGNRGETERKKSVTSWTRVMPTNDHSLSTASQELCRAVLYYHMEMVSDDIGL
jgi:hypothetical protein